MKIYCAVLVATSCFHVAFGQDDVFYDQSDRNVSFLLERLWSAITEVRQDMKELKDSQGSLRQDMKEFKESIRQDIGGLKESQDSLKESQDSLKESQDSLRRDLQLGFKGLHDFGANRVRAMRAASSRLTMKECAGSSSRHAVYFDGITTEIFTPHMSCARNMTDFTVLITCEGEDIGMIAQCPNDDVSAINITRNTNVTLGDEVVSFGFGDMAKVWRGHVSDIIYSSEEDSHQHWNLSSPKRQGDFIMQSLQHDGMSGAAVSNGCGYTGMAKAVLGNDKYAFFALVSPVSTIQRCILQNKDKLKTNNADCRNEIVDIPQYNFGVCDY